MKFTVEKDQLLLNLIKEKAGFESMTKARKLIKNGNVLINGKVENIPTAIIKAGQDVTVSFSKNKIIRNSKKKFPFKVFYEDKQVMAFLKPAGFPIRTDNRKMRSVVSEIRFWMDANEREEEFFIINKIDKRESGILLAARDLKSKKFYEPVDEQIKMRYYALCEGEMPTEDQVITHKLARNKIGILFQDRGGKNDLESTIKTRLMKASPYYSLLKVDPQNHLKNQIRAQLSIIGHPVIGDKKYSAKSNPIKRLGIHLFSMEFLHPDKKEWIKINTPVPKDFLDLLKIKSKPAREMEYKNKKKLR